MPIWMALRMLSLSGACVLLVMFGLMPSQKKLNDGIVLTVRPERPSRLFAVTGSICIAMSASPLCSICAWLAAVSACLTTIRLIGAAVAQYFAFASSVTSEPSVKLASVYGPLPAECDRNHFSAVSVFAAFSASDAPFCLASFELMMPV